MNRPAVANQDQFALQLLMQMPDEEHQVLSTKVLVLICEVNAHSLGSRRERQRADDADAIMAIPAIVNGRFSSRRPCAADGGLQYEARFVNKYEARLLLRALLFSAAHRRGTIARSPADRVRGRGFWLLRASIHSPENLPDVAWMELHAEVAFNHLRDPFHRPQLGAVTRRHRATAENLSQFPPLFIRQPWRATG